ncbi:MAG: PD-(D/E)XK nuclease family transposase, partial [Fibrobacter sp.]|nr:PD-(D/E)XK nuclease family transposase [Fibrobacter sp.]
MNYKQMNAFLREVYGTHKKGGDEKIVIDDYERKYRYVYIYNDFCVKSILTGDGKDLSLVTDLVNATLGLRGADCISNARLENPTLPGGLYKDIEHDILLGIPPRDMNIAGVQPLVNHENFQKDCRDCLKGVHHRPVNSAEQSGNGVARPWDRIAVEIQNVGYDSFNKRLMFYVARNVSNSLMKGEFYDKIPRTNVICFQMFDYLPWKRSRRYVHTIRYFDDECNLFSDYQTVTIVEVRKFLKHAKTDYAQDQCRLAQW